MSSRPRTSGNNLNATLPDINVWLALLNPPAAHHDVAIAWFSGLAPDATIYFCRVTQLSLLRMLTQRAVMGDSVVSQRKAWGLYDELLQNRQIGFLEEPTDLEDFFRDRSTRDEISPNRWADDHLIAFAEAAHLTLMTFDQVLAARAQHTRLLEA